MSVTYSVDGITPLQWSDACRKFADYSIYQTWAFGEISARDTGSQISRIVVRNDETIVGAAQMRIKKLPVVKSGLAYAYFGPIWRGIGEGNSFDAEILDCIRREYAERRGLEVRVVPNLWEHAPDKVFRNTVQRFGFSAYGLATPYRTILVNLSPTESELRKCLAQKWRNGLNQAERGGVIVEVRTDDDAMQQFEELYETMWSRKQFEAGVTVSSFRRLQQLLPEQEKLSIHLAYGDGVLAAGHVSSTLGDTCTYLLGASNEAGRACKASYALQWRAMLGAKAAGADWYDLGGIDPDENPGVFHFKAGLGGIDTTFVGTFGAPARGAGRYLVPLAERVYRAFRPLMNRRSNKHRRIDLRCVNGMAQPGSSCRTIAKLSS